MRALAILSGLACYASAIELTKENWDENVAKADNVFIKFLAPWCGHCKRMKPDWDKLMTKFADSPNVLIADVDCTAGGKTLCEQVGVRGYPSIKYGDPNDLQDYEGGREYKDLKKFAKGLGPQCGPARLDLCDDAKKAKIEEFQKMGAEKREEFIKEKTAEMEQIGKDFEKLVEGLQKQYEEANKKKDADTKAIKDADLGLMKSVHAAEKKEVKSEL